MPVSISDNPAEAKPVSGEPKSTTQEKKLPASDINDSRLNNETNCYGVGPDSGKKSIQQEVEETRAERVAKINDKSSDLLAAAAASGDADVHNLLAQRSIAELNADEDELKRIDQEIADRQKQTSK